jgi:hypothetical protein
MIVPPLVCPACETPIPWIASGGHFTCTGCGGRFKVSRAYFGTIGWLGLFSTTLLVWSVRPVFDAGFFFAFVLAWMPITGVLSTIVRRLFPPALEMEEGGLAEYLHRENPPDEKPT